MKKNLKKTFAKATALAMAVAMMVSVVPANSADAKAKKPKLSKKSVKVTVKKTKKVKIKNTKKIKKTKWSVKSKKIATLSKKKKTSVVIKGKKKGKTTVTAKITLKGKKKPMKLKVKVQVVKKKKVTPTKKPTPKPTTKVTPKPTTKPTTKPTAKPAPTPDKIGNVEVDKNATLNIPVTELNETSITCDAKRTDKGQGATNAGAEYTKKGVKFTTKDTYNSGVMYYLDPITSEADLVDAPTGENASNQGERIAVLPKEGKGGKVDIADYDYIRVTLFDSPYETNLRLYDDFDQFIVDGAGFPGTSYSFYGKDSEGRGNYVGKEPVEPGSTNTANHYYADAAKTKDAGDGYILIPVKEVVKSAKTSQFIGIAVCGQFKNQEYGISKIELLKVKGSVPATKPASVVVTPAEEKAAILNSATLQFSAKVLNKNESEMAEEQVTWSVEGDAATINDSGLLTADATKTGKVTVTATSKTDATVKGTYEVEICDETSLLSVKFTNEYTTYTIDETKDGLDISPKGLNGAGEPVADQPEITVEASDASDGISYADGKLTATKAGSITLTATSGKMKDVVTIKIVDGTRLELTADNTGWVENYASGASNATDAKATVENGVITYTSSNWNGGAYVKVTTPSGKTVANIAGLLWTYQSEGSKNNDNKPTVSVRYADLTKPNQTGTGQGNADSILYQDKEYTADEYAAGVDIMSTFDWNFCYDNAGADVTIDTSGDTAVFTLGKNGPESIVQKFKNIIVLWGDPVAMPAVKSVAISQGQNLTSVAANRTLQLKAVATHENDKTKTVTETATWESSDAEVASVSKGLVTPKKEGSVDITAKVGEVVSAKYTVTVTAAETVEPVTLTSTTEITEGNGGLKFADMTDYPASFDVSKFGKVTYKVTAYDADGLITDVSKLDNTKVCVNCSTDSTLYNYGYGDGFKKNLLKDGTMATDDTGVITLECATLSKDASVADCLSYQLDGGKVTKIVINEVKFE